MGVQVTSRSYNNRFRSEKVDWLIGNAGDWQTVSIEALYSVHEDFTSSAPLNFGVNTFIRNDGRFWNESGFDVGDSITFEARARFYTNGVLFSTIDISQSRNIISIDSDLLTYDGLDIFDDVQFSSLPYSSSDIKVDRVVVFSDKRPEGIELKYNHLKNSEVEEDKMSSFIDGNETVLSIINTHLYAVNEVGPVEKLGYQSGMSIRAASCTYLGKEGDYSYKYRVQIEFMIPSLYNDKANFEENTPTEETIGSESLTDQFSIIAFPEWNNPNTQIKNNLADTRRLGNTGWFNENFNGFEDNLSVESVVFTDEATGQVTSSLSHTSATRVKAEISGAVNLAYGITTCSYGFARVTEDETELNNLKSSYHNNISANTAGGIGTGDFTLSLTPSTSTYSGYGANMEVGEVHFYIENGNLIFEAVFNPSATFTSLIDGKDEDDRNYVLWVSVADHSLETNFSDRVNKIIDYGNLEKYIPSAGEWDDLTIELYPHETNQDTPIDQGKIFHLVEDEFLARVDFRIDLDEEDQIPNKIRFAIEHYNSVTNAVVELEGSEINLSSLPVVKGVPEWGVSEKRGFIYSSENDKDKIEIRRNPDIDSGTFINYILEYGFKIRWEDWIANNDIDIDFYNTEEKQNGRNQDWHQLQEGDWGVRIAVYISSEIEGEPATYLNTRDLPIVGYNENDNIEVDFKYYRVLDGSELSFTLDENDEKCFPLIEGEDIIIETIYTNVVDDFGPVDSYYSKTLIGDFEGAGFLAQNQISTEYVTPVNNKIRPLEGLDRLYIEKTADNIIKTKALLNTNFGDINSSKITGRIGCKNT